MNDNDSSLERETEMTEENEIGNDEGEEIEVDFKNNAVSPEEKTEDLYGARIAELEKSLEEQKDRYLRLAAEFENYKKRTSRDFAQLIESANQDFIKSLLDIVDNFERALTASKDADSEAIFRGMEMIYQQLADFLKAQGLEEIKTLGEPFDPNLHEAVMTTPSEDIPEDHVALELQKGYMLKGRVIRHSRVAVARPIDNNSQNEHSE